MMLTVKRTNLSGCGVSRVREGLSHPAGINVMWIDLMRSLLLSKKCFFAYPNCFLILLNSIAIVWALGFKEKRELAYVSFLSVTVSETKVIIILYHGQLIDVLIKYSLFV